MDEQKQEKKLSFSKKGILIAVVVVALVLAAYLGLCYWVDSSARIMPNVTVAGVELEGMTQAEAQTALEQNVTDKKDEMVVTLTCKDWEGRLDAAQMQYDWSKVAQWAFDQGRGGFLGAGAQYLRYLTAGSKGDVALAHVEAQPAYDALMAEAEQAVTVAVKESTYETKGDKLVFTKGVTGSTINTEGVAAQVMEAFDKLFAGEEIEPIAIPAKDIPIQPTDFQAVHKAVFKEPQDAHMEPKTFKVVDHVIGVDFDVNALETAYNQAKEGETFQVPLKLTTPKETAATFQAKLFRDQLGTATSRVGGSANRKTNVKLSAKACDGKIILPGETFSYNGTTGSRSASKGYLPAPVYSGGASVDDVGGGICQTSSTIYYAVLHTTLEVTERRNHMYAVGYVPDGMDATVFYGSTDFKFKNNTPYPIKLVTESYDQGGQRYLRVSIYGTNVTGYHAVPKNTVGDYVEPTTQYVADSSVPRGTTVVDRKQNPYRGRKASVVRYVYDKNGNLVEKQNMRSSNYKMRPKTIRYNPADGNPSTWPGGKPPVAPTPAPAPAPAPTPAPAPEPAA